MHEAAELLDFELAQIRDMVLELKYGLETLSLGVNTLTRWAREK